MYAFPRFLLGTDTPQTPQLRLRRCPTQTDNVPPSHPTHGGKFDQKQKRLGLPTSDEINTDTLLERAKSLPGSPFLAAQGLPPMPTTGGVGGPQQPAFLERPPG